MAKSKSGGTRSYIRGRVGADVYSIGKDGKGAKQQVVRSLAETVANPQTQAQMKGRMIMSTVMQAVSALRVIIDHSFDNVPVGQPCVSEFIRQNYALIKADAAAHPASGNSFGLNKYQEKGAKQGIYVISQGSANLPAAIINAAAGATITETADSLTFGSLRDLLGMGVNDYFTVVGLSADGKMEYARFHLDQSTDPTTAISSANIADVFAIEANCTPTVSVAGKVITIALPNAQANSGIIFTKKEDDGFKHSSASLLAVSSPDFTSDVALPTYPVGNALLLNGGNFNGGGTPWTPEPVGDPALLSVTLGSTSVQKGGSKTGLDGEENVAATMENAAAGVTYKLIACASTSAVGSGQNDIVLGTFANGAIAAHDVEFPSGFSTLHVVLCSGNAAPYTLIEEWCTCAG